MFHFRRKKKCAGLDDSSDICQGGDNFSISEGTQENIEDKEEDARSPFSNMPSLLNSCLDVQQEQLNTSSV